ncbi:MAG: hypothetical protein H6741_20390 [Alphaproteobacteria bacterium]|nr:hypothetical protein [Alphaproteobacteria bacterium]
MSETPPSLLTRLRTAAYHSARILFLPWPRYTFDDLATVQDCLDGPAFREAAERLRQDPEGREILRERPDLGMLTVDWQALSLLPLDSMGYNFWHHFYSNGLLRVVPLGPPTVRYGADADFLKDRYRATHDLRHVLLGLGVEGYEEIVLQSFQCAQLFQKLSALIVVLGGLKHALVDRRWRELWRGVPEAWRLGRRSRFLLLMPCEAMWETPLEEVRRAYGITPVGPRYPVSERHPDAGQVFDLGA